MGHGAEREAAFKPGDRVYVTDPFLAKMREIMRNATGQEPEPNHHGTIEEVWDTGSILIYFDDGTGSPWPVDQVRHLVEHTNLTPPAEPGAALPRDEDERPLGLLKYDIHQALSRPFGFERTRLTPPAEPGADRGSES